MYACIYLSLFKSIYLCVCVCVCIERDIYSPTPVGLSSPANEVIVLPLVFVASLFIYELRSR